MSEILIADDELQVRRNYRALLEAEGYAVRTARDGEEALRKFAERRPDLLLLDVMMPKKNGISVCEEIRATDACVPIVFFTALPSESALVRGLGLGADDYIDKSDGVETIVARVRRALARVEAFASAAPTRRARIGRAEVDFDTYRITGGSEKFLTKTEADILWLLNSSRGQMFAYDDIIDVLRGRDFVCTSHMLYVHVSRIKQKLGSAGELIRNIRNVGYRLD